MKRTQDAFGTEIKVGSRVVHSAQGYAHRHRMRRGTVTKVYTSTSYGAPAYAYTDDNGRKRTAYDTTQTVVIG